MGFDAGAVYTILGGKLDGSGFAKFDAANKAAIASAAGAERQFSASQQRMGQASKRVAQAQAETAAATRRAATSQAEHSVSIAKTESEMAKLEKTIHSSGVATKLQSSELDLLTKRHAELSHALENSAAKTTLWSRNNQQAAKNLNTLGTVAAKSAGVGLLGLAVATIYAAKTAGDFEKQMRNVNSIAKLSEQGYRNLSKGVLSLAGETAQAPKVLAEGLYQLVSSGFNASDSLTILRSSAKAATAGLTDTETATKAVAAVLNAYREPASKASSVSDILFETVNRGVLTFAELSKEIGTVLPFAASLGVALPQVGAAISTLTKEGISAPETMTRIKQAMVSIIKPSVDMKKAIAETGASSGQALVKQKGFQGALEALVKTTDGSKESMAKLFPNIRALGGVLALTGNNAKSAQQDLKAFQDTTGATQAVFNEQAKGAEFAGKRLIASLETDAILVGDKVLPILADGAKELTKALQGAAQDGSLEAFGNSILNIFGTVGQVVGNVAPEVEGIAKALVDVGSAVGLGNASELAALLAAFATFKGVTFVAPILASVAGAISEIGLAAATAPSVAAFAADLLAMAGPAGLIAGGLALAAGAFVAFNSGLFDSASAAEKDAAALEADKAAVEGLAGATQNAASANTAAERAQLSHKEAGEALKRVEKEVADGTLKGAAAQNALLGARLRVAESSEQVAAAHQKAVKALDEETHSSEKAEKTIGSRQQETLKQIDALEKESQARGKRNFTLANGESAEQRRNKLQAEYNRQAREAAQALAEVAVAEESRHRIEAGKGAIEAKNAQGVKRLQDALFTAGAPQKIVTKYELDDQGAQAKLGNLSAQLSSLGQQKVVAKVLTTAPSAGVAVLALKAVLRGVPGSKVVQILAKTGSAQEATLALKAVIAGVPPSKVIHIVTTAPSAQAGVSALQSAINALQSKTVTVTTILRTVGQTVSAVVKGITGHASGRSSGANETAIVGEGRGSEYVVDRSTGSGYVVHEPTVVGLSPDEYVIPLEERFRGRALGLFAMLAKDLEIPGYAKGKAPSKGKGKGGGKAHHPMPVPDAIQPLSLPLADIEKKRDDAKTAEDKAKSKVKSEESKIRTLEKDIRTGSRAKKPDHGKLREYRAELAKERAAHERDSKQFTEDKQALKEWNRTVREARQFAAKIKHVELEVSNDRNAMQLAAGRDDFPAYSAAKDKRIHDLGRLATIIQEARDQVKTGTDYALELEGQIQQAQLEAGSTAAESPETSKDKEAEAEEQTGETAAERAEQARIEKDIALAALTPDLGDDTSRAQELVNFFGKVLGEVQAEPGARGGDTAIKQVAEAYKQAQNNLASLTGGGTNDNSDLQAQIDQKNQQLEVEKQRANTNERALEVFGGSGDIGAGGANASQAAAGVTQNIYTLHPGDPQTLRAIGDAATSGIGLQGSRQSVRVRVGP